jgi:hypothetical protein
MNEEQKGKLKKATKGKEVFLLFDNDATAEEIFAAIKKYRDKRRKGGKTKAGNSSDV